MGYCAVPDLLLPNVDALCMYYRSPLGLHPFIQRKMASIDVILVHVVALSEYGMLPIEHMVLCIDCFYICLFIWIIELYNPIQNLRTF